MAKAFPSLYSSMHTENNNNRENEAVLFSFQA